MTHASQMPPGYSEPTAQFFPPWYVGTQDDYIEFGFALSSTGEVVLNSVWNSHSLGVFEPFLFETWRRYEAMEAAHSLVKDAKTYLEENGFPLDGNTTTEDFLKALRDALGITLQ